MWLIVSLLLLVSCTTQQTNVASLEKGDYKIVSESVNYFENVQGHYARPLKEGNYPGVILIHEWWGLNDQIKEMADLLATEGYLVLAVDLHNGKVAATPDEARQLTGSLNQSKAIENMRAALGYLKYQGATKLASYGWCFGGGQSMQLAIKDGPLAATVIYYGQLVTNQTQLENIKWPVLGIFGQNDTGIPPAKVNEFDSALDALKIENEIYNYPGVGHAFANPSGMNYAPAETKDAWLKTLKFLNKHLKE